MKLLVYLINVCLCTSSQGKRDESTKVDAAEAKADAKVRAGWDSLKWTRDQLFKYVLCILMFHQGPV